MAHASRSSRERRPPPPLDAAALERLALRYVERFATTEGRLADYLRRKLRERGAAEGDAPDATAVAARMVTLGYVDDRGYAEARAAALSRHGYGERRVAATLRAAHVGEAAAAPALEHSRDAAVESALALARRRRIGPFAPATPDDKLRERQLAIMLRAGHGFALSRAIVNTGPGETFESD